MKKQKEEGAESLAEDQEISLNWSSEPSKQKPKKIKQEDEEPEIEDIVEETFSPQPQPTETSSILEPEQIQDPPIQNLEADLQDTPGQNQEQEQTMTYDSNSGVYDSEPVLINSPSLRQRPQGFQQPTRFETPSAWRQAKIQNSAWEQTKINETAHINPTDIKKYNPFSEDFAKRRRR